MAAPISDSPARLNGANGGGACSPPLFAALATLATFTSFSGLSTLSTFLGAHALARLPADRRWSCLPHRAACAVRARAGRAASPPSSERLSKCS